MIFRRLKAHVEKENWFAVAIDFAIVVIGVFIGLQVANWNEARLNTSEERIYLERLRGDLVQSLAELDRDATLLKEWREEGQGLLKALLTDTEDVLTTNPCWAVALATRTSIAAPQLATIKELIAGGRTNLITDTTLREGLVRYEAEMESFHALNDVISNRMDAITPSLASRYEMIFNPTEGLDAPSYVCGIDFDSLVEDQEFTNVLAYSLELQRNNIYFFNLMIEESQAMLALVDQQFSEQGLSLSEAS